MQQTMHYSYVQNQKPTVTGRLNGQYLDQYSRWRHGTTFSDQRTSSVCVPMHAQTTLTLTFLRNVKVVLRQKLN